MDSNINVFLFSLAGAIGGSLTKSTLPSPGRFLITPSNLVYSGMVGLLGYSFQYTLNESIRLEKNTNVLAMISSTSVLMSYGIDILIIGTPFKWTSMWGTLIVCGSVVSIILYKGK